MTTTGVYGETAVKVPDEPCIHCMGSRFVLDEVETTFGEFEEVFYLCFMCCGTGRKMTRAERLVVRSRG